MTNVVRTHEVLIRASLPVSFAYISDLTRHPEWSSGRLVVEELTPGPVTVGKEYLSYGEFVVQKNRRNTVRVSVYEPPHRFGFVANDPGVGEVSHVFTLRARNGYTLVQRTMSLQLNPIVAVFFRFLIYPLTGSPAMDKSLAMLRAKLEQRQPG